jgi:integrase
MTAPKQRRRARGEGGIRKRPDGRWEWSIRLPDGGRKTGYGRTKQDAAGGLRKALQHRDAGLPPEDGKLTVRQLLDRWLLSQRSADRSPNTIDNYAWAVERIATALGRTQLVRLSPDDVEDFLREEVAAGLSRSSLRRLHNVLAVALRYGERRGLVVRNVAALADIPKCEGRPERESLTTEQAQAFLDASKGERLSALVACGLMLGLRPGELTGLRWEDVDLDAGQLSVSASLKRERGQLRLGDVKRSRAGERSIDIPAGLLARLREHRSGQARERLAAGSSWEDHGYVFASEIGTPLDPSNVRRLFRRIGARAGIGPVVPYQLRHTAASLLLDNGATIEEVADVLGDNPTTVYRHYRHRLRASAAAAVAPMERLFGVVG